MECICNDLVHHQGKKCTQPAASSDGMCFICEVFINEKIGEEKGEDL